LPITGPTTAEVGTVRELDACSFCPPRMCRVRISRPAYTIGVQTGGPRK